MAARIANQLQIMFTLDGTTTYESVEAALIAEGFTNYDIARQVYAETTDVTVTLLPVYDPQTSQTMPFDAQETLQSLADAAGNFVIGEPAGPQSPE